MRLMNLSWQPHLTLCALALMLTLPFLMAHHYHPIPAFYQEWTAALLGLSALTLLLRKEVSGQIELPELTLLPFGLLLIVVAQWFLLPSVLPARLQLFALYLIWAALMLILGRQLARSIGLEKLSQWLASAILVGALLEALSAGLQLEGTVGMPWVFPHTSGMGVRGNLAQHNSFSNYLWLGIAAALYLRSQLWLKSTTTILSIGILIVFTVLSGSRSTWLYAGSLVLLSFWISKRQPESAEGKRALRWSLAALVGALSFQLLVSSGLLAQLADLSSNSAGSRLVAAGSSDPMRLALWQTALQIWQENPWLGAGIGQYTWQFHQHVLDLLPMRLPGLPEHAHNLPLQLMAEAGIFALLFLGIFAGRWIWGVCRQAWTPAHWFFAASLLILALHSALEYPLWYTFFLGPTALMAGALSPHNAPLRLRQLATPVMASILLLGAFSLKTLYSDYSLLENMVNGRLTTTTNPVEYQQQQGERLNDLSRSVFSPYLDLLAAASQEATPNDLAIKLATCERALRFSATRHIVFKCVHLQALAGQDSAANLALQRAAVAYPNEIDAVLAQWRTRSSKEPALATLLRNFAATAPRAAR